MLALDGSRESVLCTIPGTGLICPLAYPPSVSTPSTNHVTFKDEESLHETALGIAAKTIEVNLTAKVQAIDYYDKSIPQYPTNGNYNSRIRLQ